MSANSLLGQIANSNGKAFRRLEIKRRLDTGLYEDDWLDITDYVVKFGRVRKEIDSYRIGQFVFSNMTIIVDNKTGKFNPADSESSFWNGYSNQQRTLVRVSAGFVYESKSNGIWTRTEYPTGDEKIVFMGFISGDISIKGDNKISFPIAPLQEVFRQFNASRLTGYNDSLTASDFMFLLRDQQDASSNYIFRPFFGNTTTKWAITTTTVEYPNLSTSTAEDLLNATAWEVVQKLAQAENYSVYITNDGTFTFGPRDTANSTSFYFFGPGDYDATYKRTIKKVGQYGGRFSKYYSRVSVKWVDADTTSSYQVQSSQFTVSAESGPWILGEKTLEIENFWIADATTAGNIASAIFDEFSALKTEIDFTTSFIPHLNIGEQIEVTYDQTDFNPSNAWDLSVWANSGIPATTTTDQVTSDNQSELAFAPATSLNDYYSQQFSAPTTGDLTKIGLKVYSTTTTTGQIAFDVMGDNGSDEPDGITLGTAFIDVSTVDTSIPASLTYYTLSSSVSVTASELYFLVARIVTAPADGFFAFRYDDSLTADGLVSKLSYDAGATWTIDLTDYSFARGFVIETTAQDPSNVLIWDAGGGEALDLQKEVFRIISIELDLDKLETRFTCRQD